MYYRSNISKDFVKVLLKRKFLKALLSYFLHYNNLIMFSCLMGLKITRCNAVQSLSEIEREGHLPISALQHLIEFQKHAVIGYIS